MNTQAAVGADALCNHLSRKIVLLLDQGGLIGHELALPVYPNRKLSLSNAIVGRGLQGLNVQAFGHGHFDVTRVGHQ